MRLARVALRAKCRVHLTPVMQAIYFEKAASSFQGFVFTVFGTFSLLTMTLTAIAPYFKVTRPSFLNPKIHMIIIEKNLAA